MQSEAHGCGAGLQGVLRCTVLMPGSRRLHGYMALVSVFEAVSWLYYEIWTSDQPDWVRGPLRPRPFIFFVAVTTVN